MSDRRRFKLSASVFVIVRDDDRVLLLQRRDTGWMDGCFGLPACIHQGGEDLAQAATRALFEQTGLEANTDNIALLHSQHCRNPNNGEEWLGHFFEVTLFEGAPYLKMIELYDRIGWFALGDLPDNLIPHIRRILLTAPRGRRFSTFGWEEAA